MSSSSSFPENANAKAVKQTDVAKDEKSSKMTRLIFVHGDKGGVGKSFVAQAIVDVMDSHGESVVVIDADTANPDVSRMFGDEIPSIRTNLRTESGNGWMDVMDFVVSHPGYAIVLNTPAGIGETIKSDIASFSAFLSKQETPVEMELWWVMNIQHDSVNLLNSAYSNYGKFFSRIRVVCNLFFSNGNKDEHGPYLLWNESALKTFLEKKNGMTIYFPGLHARVVKKLFDPEKIMPFSNASDGVLGAALDLSNSERWKLQQWRQEVEELLLPALNVKKI